MEPVLGAELQLMHDDLLRRFMPPVDAYFFGGNLTEIPQISPFAQPLTQPISSRALRKTLMSAAYAVCMADTHLTKPRFSTHPVGPSGYAFLSAVFQPAGIAVSQDLIMDRDAFKKGILMVPSGLYLTWLESSGEGDEIAF